MNINNEFKQLHSVRNNGNKGTTFRQHRNIYSKVSTSHANNPSFTGWFDATLRFLDTNQAWGANFVDFSFMVLPRTGTDFTRNASAGWETARRESMGTINDSSVGLYGTAAGLALATGINKAYKFGERDLKVSSVFADSETIDMMGRIWQEKTAKKGSNQLLERLEKTLSKFEVYNGSEWVKFQDTDIKKAADIFQREIRNNEHLTKEAKYDIRKILTSSHNLESNFRIIAEEGGKLHSSRYTIESIVENTFNLAKLFSKDKVVEAFENAKGDIHKNTFIKALKKMNLKRSLWGVGIATAVGMSTQPINMYLTKRKTGSDSFVGGGKKDDSFKFKAEKALVALLFGAGVIATIGNPKNLIKNLQFKGFTPTINQLKFIYGATIVSRFMAARNENELKESSVKDMLGFANWLILGNFVQKLVAQSFDKSLIKQEKTGGILNWIRTSSLKSRDEVLHAALGQNAFKNGKALGFGEMLKAVKNNPAVLKKLRILTAAQLAGYVYSGLVLGIGIPRLNIYLTNRRMAKEKALQEQYTATNNSPAAIQNNKEKPSINKKNEDVNIKFLSNYNSNNKSLQERMTA